jgi:hypothetical protein
MGALREVLDSLKTFCEAMDNIGKIADAISSGKGYLEKRYSDAKADIVAILEEMNKTLLVTVSLTSIVTHFAFIDDPTEHAGDLREFNNRIVDGKARIAALEQDIDARRGHCSKIRFHADRIKSGNTLDHFFSIFGVKSMEENERLSLALKNIYNEELDHYSGLNALCINLQKALDDVSKVLGGPGLLRPEKVPDAAALLAEYGNGFVAVELQARAMLTRVRRLIDELS